MKLNDKALEAAAQVHWIDGSFRENAAAPDAVVKAVADCVTDYLDALDAEGLADLYEYWCERIEALPVPDKIRKGDLVACSASDVWYAAPAMNGYTSPASYRRVLRRARRQWKIGDLVDDTRDLPDGAVVRDEGGFIAEYIAAHDMADMFHIAGSAGAHNLDTLNNPRIIWLPENGNES